MSKKNITTTSVINIEPHSDYAKAIIEVARIYDEALTEILKSPVCCKGGAELKIIAQNAVVKAAKLGQSVKAKIKQN